MARRTSFAISLIGAAALFVSLAQPMSASAALTTREKAAATKLASDIKAALAALPADASETAIQNTISTTVLSSGANPDVANNALSTVSSTSGSLGLSPSALNQAVAVVSVQVGTTVGAGGGAGGRGGGGGGAGGAGAGGAGGGGGGLGGLALGGGIGGGLAGGVGAAAYSGGSNEP